MPHALAARLGAEPARPGAAPGALRAERPDLLTVVLPQSLSRQPPESQELLLKVRSQPRQRAVAERRRPGGSSAEAAAAALLACR